MSTPNANRQLKEKFAPYLMDIYAIENRFSGILASYGEQLASFKEFPEFRSKVYQWAEMCKEHTNHIVPRLASYNLRLPQETGTVGASVGDKEKGLPFSPYTSPVVDCLTTVKPETLAGFATTLYTFGNFKIASYRLLTTLAQTLGDNEVIRLAEEHLREEIEAQRWLFEHLPEIGLYNLQYEGIPVPQNAWEFAKQLELVGTTITYPTFPATPVK